MIHRRIHTNERVRIFPSRCNGSEFSLFSYSRTTSVNFVTKPLEQAHTSRIIGKFTQVIIAFIVSTKSFQCLRCLSGEKNHKCPTCGKLFRVRGDLKRHLKIHQRLIEKEQTQKIKDEAEIADSMAMYNEDCNNKPTNSDTIKPNAMYGDAANGDIFIETSNLLNEVTATATNNNIENTSLRSPRKRKSKSNVRQKKIKAQENVQESMSVLQLPATIGSLQNSETLVTSMPGDISKMLTKPQKVDGISVSVSDEQYQIYLLGT